MDITFLLQAVGAGDRAAFTRLYAQSRENMTAYAMTILAGDLGAAEDAVDEAFADIWKLAGRFNAIGNGAAWVRRIVRNKAVDQLRKASARETPHDGSFFDSLKDQRANPEDRLLIADGGRWLRNALAILNLDQREVIMLCYFEHLSLKDIAEQTGVPENTVKTRLHYARRKLRSWIEQENTQADGSAVSSAQKDSSEFRFDSRSDAMIEAGA